MVNIVHEAHEKRAAAYDGDQVVGESTYSTSEGLWIIDHTQVDDNYRGQNIAARLVEELVNRAREQGIKIMPLCPFAKKEFETKAQYRDVLYP